jgi:hypothetical protein
VLRVNKIKEQCEVALRADRDINDPGHAPLRFPRRTLVPA